MRHKENIIRLLQEGKSYNQICEELGTTKSTISFHAKRLGLGKGSNPYKPRFCKACGNEIERETSHKRKFCVSCVVAKKTSLCLICSKQTFGRKLCRNCAVQLTRYKRKKQAVEYLGGKCFECQQTFPMAVFEFHHSNPNEKSFGIAHRGVCRSWALVKAELDKCKLMCANCHRLETNTTQEKLESYLAKVS